MGLVQEGLVSEGIGLRSSQTCGTGIGSFIRWQDVREVLLYPEKHVVVLKERWITGGLGGGLRSLSLYCTPENYGTVAAMALGYTKERAESKIKIVGEDFDFSKVEEAYFEALRLRSCMVMKNRFILNRRISAAKAVSSILIRGR
ncbi:MAG: hypothetical protein QW176_03510 [Candidatus Bathyarchaeia archaeon]